MQRALAISAAAWPGSAASFLHRAALLSGPGLPRPASPMRRSGDGRARRKANLAVLEASQALLLQTLLRLG